MPAQVRMKHYHLLELNHKGTTNFPLRNNRSITYFVTRYKILISDVTKCTYSDNYRYDVPDRKKNGCKRSQAGPRMKAQLRKLFLIGITDTINCEKPGWITKRHISL